MPIKKENDNRVNRSAYYQKMRTLALSKRAKYGIETCTLNIPVVQRIYKEEGIVIDRRDIKRRRIRAAYFCEDDDYSVLLNKNLPRIPKLFALVHELKHHYEDRLIIQSGEIRCGDYNKNEFIEISAEVFAAEFIYPESEMRSLANELGIKESTCTPEKIIDFKRTCQALVSYTFIVKRFEWFGYCQRGEYKKVQFQKLEEEIYGLPIYKQPWFKQSRLKK